MLTSSLLSPFSRRASWIGPSSPSMNLLGSGPLPGRLAHNPSVIHWLFACLWGWQVYGPSASAAPARPPGRHDYLFPVGRGHSSEAVSP